MAEKLAGFVAEHSKKILITATVIFVVSFFGAASTKINYDVLSYLPEKLDSVKGEQILDEVFGTAGTAVLIVENMDSKDVLHLKEKISAINGVENVIWVDSFTDISIPHEILPDVLNKLFYSDNDDSTLMMIQFEDVSSSEKTSQAIEKIKIVMNKQCFLSGMSVLMSDTKNIVESETPIYVFAAAVLAFLILVLTMGSFILPLIIAASLGFAVLLNMGTNFWGEISYITQSIAAILQIGITMDYSIFLTDKYLEESEKTSSKTEAMKKAILKSFFSLSGSALTTLLGFASMCFMSFTLGMDIGIVMSKAVLIGLACALVILPAMLLCFFNPEKHRRWKGVAPNFGKVSLFSLKHKKALSILFITLFIISAVLRSNVNVYYDFIKALPQEMTSVVSLSKLKENFNMTTTHFVIFDSSLEKSKASQMSKRFYETEGVTEVFSLNTFVGEAVPNSMIPDLITDICISGGYELMMINSDYASSTDKSFEQIKKLNSILIEYDKNGFITGESALMNDLADVTQRDFRVTGIISVAAVFAVIAVLFKSSIIPVVLVSSIELAVFLNESIPIFTGEEVPFIAPTVIGCVQLGATVDYAILMTSNFIDEMRKGTTKFRALKAAANNSVKSVFRSSLVLFTATLGVFFVSNVSLIKSICLMLSRGAIISAAVIIVFLPALLYLTEPIFNRKGKRINEI